MTDVKITTEEFNKALELLIDGMSGAEVLTTPGAYEVFSEALNNETLALAKEIKDDEKES